VQDGVAVAVAVECDGCPERQQIVDDVRLARGTRCHEHGVSLLVHSGEQLRQLVRRQLRNDLLHLARARTSGTEESETTVRVDPGQWHEAATPH
jgi:hypothetical protein